MKDNNDKISDIHDYIKIYAVSPVAVIITDANALIVFVNEAFEHMTGFVSNDILGKNVNIFKSGRQKKKFYQNLWGEISAGRRWSGEFINYRKDKTELYESAYIDPVYDSNGIITHYVKISEDVTVHRKLIELLMRSYQVIEGIMNNTNPVMLVDENQQVIMANRFFYITTGYLSEEIAGFSMYRFLVDTDRELITEKITSLLKKKSLEEILETALVKSDNTRIYIKMKLSLLNKDNIDKNIVISIEDITEKKLTEETLAQLSYAIQQSPSSVVITDINGDIEYVNPKFSDLTGYTPKEVMGKNPRILKSGEQDDDFYKNLWDTILAGKEWRGEFHNRKKNGELYWEYASISGIKNEKGEIYRVVAVKEDVTEKRIAEDALKISEENLRKKNYFMERELFYAQQITRKFLPSAGPESSFVKTSFRYMPLDAIGGDYFTFFHPSDDTFSVFLGDVSGHGVSAALFLALVKSVTDKLIVEYGLDPGSYVNALNKDLSSNMASYFITGIYCLFSYTEAGTELIFAKGGHPPPVLQRSGSKEIELLASKGKPLGLFPDESFETCRVLLEKGDRVFLYTDGINETMDSTGKMLHYEGLLGLIADCREKKLDDALDDIIKGVHDFRGAVPLDDDIVLLGLEVL